MHTPTVNITECGLYILYLFTEQEQILNTYLIKRLKEKFSLSRYQAYRLVKKLEKIGAIRLNRISKKLFTIELADPRKIIDLIERGHARNHCTNSSTLLEDREPDRKELLRHARQLLKPKWKRVNSNHRKALDKFALRSTITREELDEITAYFELWLMDIEDKVLLFETLEGEYELLPYKTRFNSKSRALEIVIKAENCFKTAESMYNTGVFLTLTLPPIFPQRLALWILDFLQHRIKALIWKRTKETKPHIRVNEPQEKWLWNPHSHVAIFGIDYIMPKTELTRYLEKHLMNFLSNLGRHYKQTINKNATDYDVLALNLLGEVFVKKYNKYKKRHPKYEGPVNFITKIKQNNGMLVFENPPPDRKNKKLMQDGGAESVFDYIKFYMISNLLEAKEIEENGVGKIKNKTIVWYWFNRIPFFYASPILRTNQKKRQPVGWTFIGAYRLSEDSFIYKLLEEKLS